MKLLLFAVMIGSMSACAALDSSFGGGIRLAVDINISFPPAVAASGVTPSPADNGAADTFAVAADTGWQDTHVIVHIGQAVTVSYVSGLWTEQQGVISPHDSGSSSGLICGRSDCAEPAPDAPKGSLIGRVGGGQIVEIGLSHRFVADESGTLALRINDADTGLYDNAGSVVVQIVVN